VPADGPRSAGVHAVMRDGRNERGNAILSGVYLWLGTENGTLKIDMKSDVFRRFGAEEGLAGGEGEFDFRRFRRRPLVWNRRRTHAI